MQTLATDVKDISRQVVNILMEQDGAAALDNQSAILVADDLPPGETVRLDKSKLHFSGTQKPWKPSHSSRFSALYKHYMHPAKKQIDSLKDQNR